MKKKIVTHILTVRQLRAFDSELSAYLEEHASNTQYVGRVNICRTTISSPVGSLVTGVPLSCNLGTEGTLVLTSDPSLCNTSGWCCTWMLKSIKDKPDE